MPDGSARVSRSVEIAAAPERVWELVSDLPAMGAYSPEARGGRWLGDGGPRLGAIFVGTNGAGARRWSTRSTVVRCEPGRAFAFDVAAFGFPVARWSYRVEPVGDGCRLTETWQDRRGAALSRTGRLLTGVADRTAFTARSLEQTLERVRHRAESHT